jgi:hypothetical protein
MKYILLFSALWISGLTLAQTDPPSTGSSEPPHLIVRGDDMGFSHAGNLAIQECYESGIETTIEILVPSPWFPEAVSLLKNMPYVDVGVHLTLTSEWDNVKWRPLTDGESLVDDDGYFYPFVYPNQYYPNRSVLEHVLNIHDVEKEFRAQIQLAKKYIPQVSHVSAHMGCYDTRQDIRDMVNRIAKEYKIDINPDRAQVTQLHYDGPSETYEEKKASFIAVLKTLKAGQRYMFVDHPGHDTPELRAIYHKGYRNVAQDRQGVTDLWTDPDIRIVINSLGIKLIDYRDLRSY